MIELPSRFCEGLCYYNNSEFPQLRQAFPFETPFTNIHLMTAKPGRGDPQQVTDEKN